MHAGRWARGPMAEAWPDLAGRLTEYGHVLPVRVYFEDTDFSGRVYHAAYLKFMERGRSDFLRLRGIHHDALADEDRVAFAVRRMTIEFIKGATIDDLLEVETRIASLQGARVVVAQRVMRGEEALVTAEVMVALVDERGRPKRLTSAMQSRLGGSAAKSS
jgi:acyl-CoA thioester hydrolase